MRLQNLNPAFFARIAMRAKEKLKGLFFSGDYSIALYALTGGALGLVLRMAPASWVCLICLAPMLWGVSENRKTAQAAMLAYYLCASLDVVYGSAVFFGGMYEHTLLLGVLLWLSSGFVLSLPWALLWSEDKGFLNVLARMTVAYVLVTFPPIGLFGWASPMLSAGFLYPGAGFTGLAALAASSAFCVSLADKPKRKLEAYAFLAVFCALILLSSMAPDPSSDYSAKWKGLNTAYGRPRADAVDAGADRSLELYMRVSGEKSCSFIVLPENIAGAWAPGIRGIWEVLGDKLEKEGRTVVFGAEVFNRELMYDNAMMFLGASGPRVYKQRCPVPISMWVPWGGRFMANAYFFDSGLLELKGGWTAACFICYEDFIAFPMMISMMKAENPPDIIVSIGNHWWSKDTYLPDIAVKCMRCWSRLFGVPLVISMNV